MSKERDALAELVAWLSDDRLSNWPYMEGGEFYDDLAEHLAAARAVLAAPAPVREPCPKEARGELCSCYFYGPRSYCPFAADGPLAAPAQEPQDYDALIDRLNAISDEHNTDPPARLRHRIRDAAITALRAERDNAIAALDANWVQHQAIVASRERAERAEAERDALRADAERYRHIRDYPMSPELHRIITLQQNTLWDAAIDAVRKEQQ